MKTQLAILLLAFASEEASAHNLRRIDEHNQRILKGSSSSGDGPYQILKGKDKKTFTATMGGIPTLWLVLDDTDNKTGKCVADISDEILNEYYMNLAVVDKEPKLDQLGPDDDVAFLPKKGKDCENVWDAIEDAASSHKRTVANPGGDIVAVFDVDTEDDKCYKDCKRDENECNRNTPTLNCKGIGDRCEDDCEKDCEGDCKKNWGVFEKACKDGCRRRR
jgi:hypothetical protein